MALKKDEIANPKSCLNKAADDEPVFVLRAKDVLAADTVDFWADWAERNGHHEGDKLVEARALAAKMRAWRDNYVEQQERG